MSSRASEDTRRAIQKAKARKLCDTGVAEQIRQANLLSYRDVAEGTGYGVSTVFRWLHGERVPRGDAAVRLADFFDRLLEGGR